MSKRTALLIFTLLFGLTCFAQDIKSMQETFLEAEYFFMVEDYSDALPVYLNLYETMPDNANLAYRIGVCYLNISDSKHMALDYLKSASKKISSMHKDGTVSQLTAPYDALYQLGVACRINYRFDEAKESFMKYRETLLEDDTENISFIDQEIETCNNASNYIGKPVEFIAENAGGVINDEKDNFNPVISGDGKTFMFMTSLPFYDAVMFSRFANGKWTTPRNITPELQVDEDIYISCLSVDGKTLLFSTDNDFNSDLMQSTFDGTKWSTAVRLNTSINTKYWESHGSLSEDGSFLVFASDRPGGYGGLDIYISRKTDGDWGPAVNIGHEINTALNEDRPFLINSEKTLLFSSQSHMSMGGYDIFRSDKQPSGLWGKPQNLGYPFNTPDDNIFYMPVGNGKSGYTSLYRETEGKGKQDIFKIMFK